MMYAVYLSTDNQAAIHNILERNLGNRTLLTFQYKLKLLIRNLVQ